MTLQGYGLWERFEKDYRAGNKLAGAWTRPGHGYGAVIPGGLECFAEIMKMW